MEHIDATGNIKLGVLKEIHDCNKRNLPIYYTIEDLINMILSGDFEYIIYRIDNILIGYLILYKRRRDSEYHVYSISVDKEHRGNNYATSMINYIQRLHPKIKCLYLKVSVNNTDAINCYKKNNFIIVTTKTNYYRELIYGSKDAYVMMKSYVS